MKIRNGFVSNSSSSSFVIIGVKKSNLSDDILNTMQDDSEIHEESINKDLIIYGYLLGRWDDDDIDIQTCKSTKLQDLTNKLITKYNIKLDDIQLYFGMSYE